MKLGILILFSLLLGGCATLEEHDMAPFLTVGVGYQIEDGTDYWLQRERSWQCDEWQQAILKLGIESKAGWALYLEHNSWWLCGDPFNSKPEVDYNQIVLEHKFGGIK